MIRFIDEAVERTHGLMRQLISDDFILVFQSDNGGNPNVGGYNMPLRG